MRTFGWNPTELELQVKIYFYQKIIFIIMGSDLQNNNSQSIRYSEEKE
jgi:hypothetical protein